MQMKMEAKYIRRRRVAFAIAVVLASMALWAMYQITGHIWWVGDHYCWGEMTECYFGK